MDPIEIVGMGVRSPFGEGAAALNDGLCRGVAAFVRYDPFVHAGMRHPFAAPIPPSVQVPATHGDRGSRLLDAVVRDALAEASDAGGLSGLGVPVQRVGLYVGTSAAGVGALAGAQHGRNEGPEPRYAWETEQVARCLGVRGPVQVVASVCAAGAQAVAEAAAWIRAGVIDAAVAAGYDELQPFVVAGFDALHATAARPEPFRAGRSGLVLGEAAAALVLARPGLLPARVLGTLEGWASAADAYHVTAPHPDGIGLAAAVRRALSIAGCGPDDIGAINAHGTSTIYNDRMEARAVESVFGLRPRQPPLYTVKGTIGHTLGAAGALEAVVSLVSMHRGIIPPTVTSGEADPECDVDLVTETRAAPVQRTLSLSAGFGGVNCALVLGGGR